MVFLSMVCVYDGYPKPWNDGSLDESMLLTAAAVLLVGAHAFWVSRRVSWPLARDPSLRERLMAPYERGRFIHQMVQFGLYALSLGVFGWGWAGRQLTGHGVNGTWIAGPGTESLILLPFLAGQVLTWLFFYDADRAVHRAAHRTHDPDLFSQILLEPRSASVPPFGGRWTYVAFQFRQKLALVFIPVLLLIGGKELSRLIPPSWQSQSAMNGVGFLALACVFIGMPWLIRVLLGLKPLPPGVLRDRLFQSARRLGFRCSDILLWNTRGGMANAMVIGLIPWLRYVVFTDRLIEEFPEDEVEAVFGHEVGHVRHYHMLYYLVFLVVSMMVIYLVAEDYLLPILDRLVTAIVETAPARFFGVKVDRIGQGGDLDLFPVVMFVVGYIFVVFGFLSRRCERQADVFGCRAVSCGDPDCRTHAEETSLVAGGKALCPTGIRTFVRARKGGACQRHQPGSPRLPAIVAALDDRPTRVVPHQSPGGYSDRVALPTAVEGGEMATTGRPGDGVRRAGLAACVEVVGRSVARCMASKLGQRLPAEPIEDGVKAPDLCLAKQSGYTHGSPLGENIMPTTTDRITKTPGICGGRACIRGHRIPVWVLVGYRELGQSNAEILRGYPTLTTADLEAAWEYAAISAEEIERDIRQNEEGDPGFVE